MLLAPCLARSRLQHLAARAAHCSEQVVSAQRLSPLATRPFAAAAAPAAGMAGAEDSAAFYAPIRAAGSGAFKYFVDGEWRESASGKTVPVLNPSTQAQEYAVQGERGCGGFWLSRGVARHAPPPLIQ